MGRRRMGHEASVSDAVLRVPLLVAHPDIDAAEFEEATSLASIYDLCMSIAAPSSLKSPDIREILNEAASQYPATGGRDDTLEKYPEVSVDAVEYRSVNDAAVVYEDGWKVVAESTGDRWALKDGERVNPERAPEGLLSIAKAHLQKLSKASEGEPSQTQVSQLEALGYL